MPTPETKTKNKIKEYLKTVEGCWFYSAAAGAYSTHGVPDIVGLIRGRFFGIEVKRPGAEKNTTKLQDYALECIRRAGGLAFVASDVDTVKHQLFLAGLVIP
jgi:Holliday junction resolvase